MPRLLATCLLALMLPLACRSSLADNLASGRSVELDALNAHTAVLLLGESKLYALDLETGKASLIADSKYTWFAVDRRSSTVLSATRADGGTDLTLYHLNNNSLNPSTKSFVRLAVGELQSAKSNNGPAFLLSGFIFGPTRVEGEIPILVHQIISPDPLEGELRSTPVPGLSEISTLTGAGTIGFSGDDQGTFAYATSVSPESLIAIKGSVNLPTPSSPLNCLFAVVSGGRIKYAWPVPFPSPAGGRVIGFARDGRQMLARLSIGANMLGPIDAGFKLVDLNTGKMVAWPLGNPYDVLAVDGTLGRALIQSQYVLPPPGTPDDAPVQKVTSFAPTEKWRWRAELAEVGKPPVKILQVDGGDVELAGTFVDGRFFVTDGQTIGIVDDQNRVSNMPIVFDKQ